MSVGPNINVWTPGKGARGKWKLHLSTPDIAVAAALALELKNVGKQVALYELGLFEHEGQQVAGQVGFWWSENLNEYMEMGRSSAASAGRTSATTTFITPSRNPCRFRPRSDERAARRRRERSRRLRDHGRRKPVSATSRRTAITAAGSCRSTSCVASRAV